MTDRGGASARNSQSYDVFGGRPRRRAKAGTAPIDNGYGDDAVEALERGEYDEVPRKAYTHTYSSYGYAYHGGWGCGWPWTTVFSVINFIGLVVLAVFFIIHATSQGHYRTSGLGDVAPGQSLRVVPSSVKLQPSPTQIQTRTYKFELNGIYARYPADGGTIQGLKDHDTKNAQFCCEKEVAGMLRTSTNRVCASAGKVLQYTVEVPGNGKDGYMLVTANKDLIGAKCTLTWSATRQQSA